ncbi:hypothetical protein GTA08_BOTSDO12657 [Botryosphaeria dothidea]|uniref:Uncharacterized protein n=1 Tax=Botryosphaeria dothidea TaxID=55169 RepID=A0A8H4N7A9_9PEZI|nr:hypothetical protein GTA08_BOTSDO14006 [Botryosphaeria dothidea]KAF4311755.1 hypothetical protein GTA08_BOTSDO12657 [Botryosphaeria dothidea]
MSAPTRPAAASSRSSAGPQPVRAKRAAPPPPSKQPNLANLLSERLSIAEPTAALKREREERLPVTTTTAVEAGGNGGGKGDGGDEDEDEEEEGEHPPWCNCSGIGTADDPLLHKWKR